MSKFSLMLSVLSLLVVASLRAVPPAKQARRMPPIFVERSTPGKELRILDCRAEADTLSLADQVPLLIKFCQLKTALVARQAEAGQEGLKLAQATLADTAQEVAAVVVIIDEGAQAPKLALYPEDRMAVINSGALLAGAEEQQGLTRLKRELWRAVGFIAGGIASDEHCVMKPILKPEDLDQLTASTFSPAVAMRISQEAARFGFGRQERVPYHVACAQGWAPQPTNEQQRAIWERMQKIREAKGKKQ